ncbi:MAG TPA: hypothetical protein EYQ24_11455 [Bacteroidetes bacterium]|nr:hypothetical protein [Bacteroidota bacterium]HIL58813.1 hypothetical protein [Rhodothermales bacterium]
MRDPLLRTFASVRPGTRVLSIGTASAVDLARLGFDVTVAGPVPDSLRDALSALWGEDEVARRVTGTPVTSIGLPDAAVAWVAAELSPGDSLAPAFREMRRVLQRGGWVWVYGSGRTPEELTAAADAAGLAVAEAAVSEATGARGIFRRVGEGVSG